MKNNIQLINNLIGQLEGIKRMMDQNKDCLAVLTQIKAVKAGLNSVMDKYIMENMGACMKKSGSSKDFVKLRKLISEITKK